MATSFKRLGVGNIVDQNNTITAYIVPLSYKTIIKSFVISNGSAAAVAVTVQIANINIMSNYLISPNDTIVVPVMDQLLIAGNSITLYATAANSISFYISGVESLVTDPEYSDVLRVGLGSVPVSSGTIVSAASKDRIVKGITLCNTSSTDRKISMEVFGWRILQVYTLKGFETILIPAMDLLIPAYEYMTASSSASGINYYITAKEL